MDNSTEVSHTIESFRVRVSSNRQLVLILSENIKDLRVKRIASLLEEITPHSEAICISTQQVYEICQNAHILHRGFHPQLSFLKEEMVTASSYLAEVLKRILLYLEHMQIIGSKLPGNIMHLTKSAITEQKQLADQLRLQAFQAIKTAVSRTPGPGVMPHKNCHNAAAEEKKDLRPLFNNQPLPMGDEYDARWDPDFKVPGSQYSKFLRFSGPFFASNEVGDAIFDDFRLPETVGSLIDSWTSKYDGVKSNFKETHRLPRRVTSRAKNALIARQKVSYLVKKLCFLLVDGIFRVLIFPSPRTQVGLMILNPSV